MGNLGKKFEREEVMRLLFGEQFEDLVEDGFEGSKEEYQMFEEVFHRTNMEDAKIDDTRTKLLAANASTDQVGEGTKMIVKETSAFESFQESSSSCGGSSAHSVLLTRERQSSVKHAYQENAEHIENPDTCTDLACLHPFKVVSDVPMKRSTYERLPSTVPLHGDKKSPEHSYPPTSSDLLPPGISKLPIEESGKEPVLCREVDSLEQGIVSTCNILNRDGYTDTTKYTDDSVVLNCNGGIQHIEDAKVAMEGKSVTSPISQESAASGLPTSSATLGTKETSSAIICLEKSAETPLNSDSADAYVNSKTNPKRMLPCRLELCAHRLLVDAGWKIEPRQRNDRTRRAYFFKNAKEGLVAKALTVAWKACGERLLASESELEWDENGREWWDAESFWRDMTDMMAYIDIEANQQDSSVSLLHRWQLLDPFMAVVWIDKKVGALRAGKGLRAMKSTTFVLGGGRRMVSADAGMNSADKRTREVKLRLANSLNQSIVPDSQNSEATDLQNSHNVVRCKGLHKKGTKSLAKHVGRGLHNVKCLSMGSTGLVSRRKRSQRLSRRPPFRLRDPHFLYYSNNENKILRGLEEEILSLEADENHGQIHMLSELQSPLHQASQHEGSIVSSEGIDQISNSICQEFSLKLKRTSAAPTDDSSKIACKKSKKMSTVGATEAIGNEIERELFDTKCDEVFASSMGEKGQLDLLCYQKEADRLISEPASECFQKVKLFEKQTSNAYCTLRIEESNEPAKTKIHKKPLKSEIKATRQQGKNEGIFIMPKGHTLSKEGVEHHKPIKRECITRRLNSNESSFISSKKQKLTPEFNMASDQLVDHKVADFVDGGSSPKESDGEGICNGVLITPSGVSPDNGKANKSKFNKKNGRKFSRCRINDDDLLISAIIKNKDFGSCSKKFSPKLEPDQLKALRKLTSLKRKCKLLPRAPKKGGNYRVDGRHITLGTRTVLCWLLEMGIVSLKDAVECRNPKNNAVIKDGWVTREGILCICCTQLFSVSGFMTHAGSKQQKSSLNLFMQSGKPYTLCLLQAWSAEFNRRKNHLQVLGASEMDENDDTCGICGDGGDLICCDNCPSTYHQMCLSPQELPEGNWYCTNCICVTCSDLVNGKETSNALAVLECSQCGHKYHSECIGGNTACYGDVGSSLWFCRESCQEVYMGLCSRVGVVNHIDDKYSWTILRCSHDYKNVCSKKKIAFMAECNTKLAIALILMEECFLRMVDPRTGIDMIPHVLYNLGSPFARLNYQGFYAVVLEKCDQLISVASVRVHGARVAEMPLIATCSKYRRQGMCRRLLNAVEKMLISLKVKMLVLSAVPSVVETWTSGFGFKPVKDDEKQQLNNVNLMMFPGTTLLKKNLYEASAQESGGFAVENIYICSREQQSSIRGDLNENANTVRRPQSIKNPTSDLDGKSLLPIVTNIQAEFNFQQGELPVPSHNINLDPMNGERTIPTESVKVAADNLRDNNDAISADDQAVKGPCSPIRHEEVPHTSQNASILAESCFANVLSNKEKISISSDEVERGSILGSSEGNVGGCTSDKLDGSNLNQINLGKDQY